MLEIYQLLTPLYHGTIEPLALWYHTQIEIFKITIRSWLDIIQDFAFNHPYSEQFGFELILCNIIGPLDSYTCRK